MSGHSKWSTIKRKKGEADAKRANVFTKIAREIAVAVKEGGADPENNGKLRDILVKARLNNMPGDNVERCIKKAAGGEDKNEYESIVYEGYGPCGVAVMVECLTDNRNRTAGEVRHYFDKYGGNLGTTGCVSFMFSRCAQIVLEQNEKTQEQIFDDCILSGADNVEFGDGLVEVTGAANDFSGIRNALIEAGYEVISADIVQIPSTFTKIDDEEMYKKFEKMLDMLEENDDVQNVFHNLDD